MLSHPVTVYDLIEILHHIEEYGSGEAVVLLQTQDVWPKGNGIRYGPVVRVSEPNIVTLKSTPESWQFADVEVTDKDGNAGINCVIISPYEEESDEV